MEEVSFDEDPNAVIVSPLQPNKWHLTDWMQQWGMAKDSAGADRILLISSGVILLLALAIGIAYLIPHHPHTTAATLVPLGT